MLSGYYSGLEERIIDVVSSIHTISKLYVSPNETIKNYKIKYSNMINYLTTEIIDSGRPFREYGFYE